MVVTKSKFSQREFKVTISHPGSDRHRPSLLPSLGGLTLRLVHLSEVLVPAAKPVSPHGDIGVAGDLVLGVRPAHPLAARLTLSLVEGPGGSTLSEDHLGFNVEGLVGVCGKAGKGLQGTLRGGG